VVTLNKERGADSPGDKGCNKGVARESRSGGDVVVIGAVLSVVAFCAWHGCALLTAAVDFRGEGGKRFCWCGRGRNDDGLRPDECRGLKDCSWYAVWTERHRAQDLGERDERVGRRGGSGGRPSCSP